MYMVGFVLLIISSSIYISKLSYYNFPLQIDYKMYLWFSQIRIHVVTLSRIVNLSMALLMAATVVFLHLFKGLSIWKCIILMFPIVFFFVSTDYVVGEMFYLKINTAGTAEAARFYEDVSKTVHRITLTIFFVYLAVPILVLIRYYMKSHIKTKRRYACTFGACMLMMLAFLFIFTMNSSVRYVLFDKVGLLKVQEMPYIYNGYILYPIVVMLMLSVVVFIMLKFKPFDALVIFRRKKMNLNASWINKDLSMILHSYKNALLCIEKYADISSDSEDIDDIKDNVTRIDEIAEHARIQIERVLNFLRNKQPNLTRVNVVKCIDETILHCPMLSDIRFVREYRENFDTIADKIYLGEIFLNLLSNSAEAVAAKNSAEKIIKITVGTENDYGYIDIEDNGVGIEKKKLRKIFRQYYSTKSRANACGVGLTFVKNMLKEFYGDITVESVPSEYTRFQVVLPVYSETLRRRQRGNKKWIK
ncbi:MAG: HAMP domain-containing sensor histidine kinase, partial [Clostridiales bacterium]|nr:HAMP domain-containing sensor histidine kinase [Clostridiales bacterium]